MKKVKFLIPLLILFIAIGFATVSISLSIEGNTDLAGDIDDFNVYYSNVLINGEQDLSIVYSNTKLDFSTLLQEVGESYVIDYDVTNASKYFDAQITMSCTSSTEHLLVQNEFDTNTNLMARSTRSGKLTLKKLKSIASYDSVFENISCSMVATPVERDSVGNGEVPGGVDKYTPMLLATSADDTTAFRGEYREKITKVKFEDQINIPDEAEESWDISKSQDGTVMAYVVGNDDYYSCYYEDEEFGGFWDYCSAYDLVIQSNGKVYANQDMSYWFFNMDYLQSIDGLEYLDTSVTTDMSYMFAGAGDAYDDYGGGVSVTLDLGSFDTSSVTDMSYMFYNLGSYYGNAVIDVSSFDTSKVTNMSYMFAGVSCYDQNIVLDLSHFDTSNVTNMSGMFRYLTAGEYDSTYTVNVDVSSFDTSKVTDMSYMFSGIGAYEQAVSLDVSNFDTSNVTNMSHMFSYIGGEFGSLTVDVSGFNTSKVTNISHMFDSVGGYTTTIDVSNFDTSNVTDMSYMLYNWGYYVEEQITLDISNFDTSKVTNMSHAFGGINQSGAGVVLDVSNFDTSNVTDMSYAFSLAYDVIGEESITTDKVTDMSGMFYRAGYKNPDFTLDVSHFNTSNVTNMNSMLGYTGYLNPDFTLDVSGFDTSKVTDMGYMFSYSGNSNNMFELDVSHFDTSQVTNMEKMFWGYRKNATEVVLDLSNFDTSKVTNMEWMFNGVGENSETVELNLSSFDTSQVTNMENMFTSVGKNSSVFDLDLRNFDTSEVTDMSSMFDWTGAYNPNFTLQLDDSFDTSNVTTMKNMFRYMGQYSTVLNFAITIRNPNMTSYALMFDDGAVRTAGSQVTLNYTSETESIVDKILTDKPTNANVVKGYNESVSIDFTVDGTSYTAYEGMTWDQWVDECDESGNFFVNSDDTVSYMLTGFEWADVGYDEAFAFTNIYGSDIIEAGKEYILDW